MLFSALVFCGLFLAAVASGQVAARGVGTDSPYLRYEGVLTDPVGARVAGEYTMTFRIFDVLTGGSPLWTEEREVEVEGGLFTVTLGREVRIPADLLAGEGGRYVELEVEGETLSPRSEIIGGGGSYAASSPGGVLGGPGAIPFGGVPTGPAGGDLTGNYPDPLIAPNAVESPEIVDGSIGSADIADGAILNADISAAAAIDPAKVSGTAWTSANDGPGSGLNADLLDGVSSEGFLTTAGDNGRPMVAADLFEGTVTLTSKYVNESGPDEVTGSVASTPTLLVTHTAGGTALRSEADGASSNSTYGVYGDADNTSSGNAFGGYFTTSSSGTGTHYGVYVNGSGSSTNNVRGVYGQAMTTGSGEAVGGKFYTGPSGTGARYGIDALCYGSSSVNVRGIYAYADNSGSGQAVAGKFYTESSGSGDHYGLLAQSYGASSGTTYGVYGDASNSLDGDVYCGYFSTSSEGEGTQYALYADGLSRTAATAYGVRGDAENSWSGYAYGGRFWMYPGGGGTHYGVYGYEAAGGMGAAVYASGDMVASGAKPAVVRTSQGHRFLYAQESPEVWFEDFGEGRLESGRDDIDLDPLFLETVTIDEENPMKVFIQLLDDCKGTYVERSLSSFDVFEIQGGTSDASFTYRVVAKRKNYEDERFRLTGVGYEDPNLYPELLATLVKEHEEERHQRELVREKHRLESERGQEEQRTMDGERLHHPTTRRKE